MLARAGLSKANQTALLGSVATATMGPVLGSAAPNIGKGGAGLSATLASLATKAKIAAATLSGGATAGVAAGIAAAKGAFTQATGGGLQAILDQTKAPSLAVMPPRPAETQANVASALPVLIGVALVALFFLDNKEA